MILSVFTCFPAKLTSDDTYNVLKGDGHLSQREVQRIFELHCDSDVLELRSFIG